MKNSKLRRDVKSWVAAVVHDTVRKPMVEEKLHIDELVLRELNRCMRPMKLEERIVHLIIGSLSFHGQREIQIMHLMQLHSEGMTRSERMHSYFRHNGDLTFSFIVDRWTRAAKHIQRAFRAHRLRAIIKQRIIRKHPEMRQTRLEWLASPC